MQNFIKQLRENYLAIISLFIAILALIHTNWLYDKSETNRNIRTASFEILMKLGELQQEVNQLHFDPSSGSSTIAAWGRIALIGDLSKLVPAPVPKKIEQLTQVWNENYGTIKESEKSTELISQQIDEARDTIIKVIQHLKIHLF